MVYQLSRRSFIRTTLAVSAVGATGGLLAPGRAYRAAAAPFVPYTAGSFFQSSTTGAPVDLVRTAAFRSLMATHPDQKNVAYPVIRGVGGNMWGSVYAEGKASHPLWHIRNHAGYGKAETSSLRSAGFRAPEWLGDMLTGTSDSPFTVMDRSSGFTVRGDKAKYVGNHQIDILSGGSTAVYYHSSNGLDRRNPRANDNRNWSSRGRLSDAMIRRDLVDHAISTNSDLGHVLHLYLVESKTASGYCHPMVGSENNKFGFGAEGERIMIAPNVDVTKRGLSPAGLVIARTLKRRGCYIGDNAGNESSLQAEVEKPTHMVWGGLLTKDSLKGITWKDFVCVSRGWQG